MSPPKSRWLIPLLKLADATMEGLVNDEEWSWHNQIDHIKRKCFSALSTLRRYKDVMPSWYAQEVLHGTSKAFRVTGISVKPPECCYMLYATSMI